MFGRHRCYAESCLFGWSYAWQIRGFKRRRPMVLGGMCHGVSTASTVCLGDHAQSWGAAWHRGGVGGWPDKSLLIGLDPKDGVTASSRGGNIWSECNGTAQLGGYVERIWTPNLHGAVGWLLILPGNYQWSAIVVLSGVVWWLWLV
jgi:hypothetical protein